MNDVLLSTKYVVDNSMYVSINREHIVELVTTLNSQDLPVSEINHTRYPWDLDTLIRITFVFNTLIYCLWAKKGEEKWSVDFGDRRLDGSTALFRCLEEEVKRKPDFLKGETLANLTITDVKRIFKGNSEIPLTKERLSCLNEAGSVLCTKYDGDFMNVYQKSNNNAVTMVVILVTDFPSFNDETIFRGQVVAFYKRAQLNSKMISDVLVANGKNELTNLDKLTAFADYKVPQKLRSLGILEYTSDLADKIDNYVLIEPNSEEEIEIRANTVWAVEYIKEELQKKYPFVNASHIDSMLWNLSQTKKEGEKPYHRTLTIAY